jgi:hypothetical protein
MPLKRYDCYLDYVLSEEPLPMMTDAENGNYISRDELIEAVKQLKVNPTVTNDFRMGYALALVHIHKMIGKD